MNSEDKIKNTVWSLPALVVVKVLQVSTKNYNTDFIKSSIKKEAVQEERQPLFYGSLKKRLYN
jgi:hypothetical protein